MKNASGPESRRSSEPETNIVRFRAVPEWCPIEKQNALNDRLQRALRTECEIFVSLPTYRESQWLRVVPLNPFTDDATIDRLFSGIDAFLADRTDSPET